MRAGEAMVRGAVAGLIFVTVLQFISRHFAVIMGLVIGGLCVAWFWNEDANTSQMRKAIEQQWEYGSAVPATSQVFLLRVTNHSRYDMDNVVVKCGTSSNLDKTTTLKSGETSDLLFDYWPTDGKCFIDGDPVDRLKLGNGLTQVKSMGSF